MKENSKKFNMKLSIFKISLGLMIIGVVWLGFLTSNSHNMTENFTLNIAQTGAVEINLNNDIGFYKVALPELGNSVFVQILDPNGNIISDKKLETKLAINYFDINQNGIYSLKITNISKNSLPIQIQIGQINTEEYTYPGIILIIGVLSMVISSYIKLKNYKIAQPDENIS